MICGIRLQVSQNRHWCEIDIDLIADEVDTNVFIKSSRRSPYLTCFEAEISVESINPLKRSYAVAHIAKIVNPKQYL